MVSTVCPAVAAIAYPGHAGCKRDHLVDQSTSITTAASQRRPHRSSPTGSRRKHVCNPVAAGFRPASVALAIAGAFMSLPDPAVGSISTMSVTGNFSVLDGSTMKFDFNGTSHDSINVSGNLAFPILLSSVIADASVQPPAGAYTLISSGTNGGGTLPTLSGSLTGASLAFGSLIANVAAAPTPAPTVAPTRAPTPAPTAAPSGSLNDLVVALMDGNEALAGQLISEMTSSPLTTFASLLLKEQERQSQDRQLGQDNVVDDNQCRR
jgi:hypothetical protein